MYQVPNFFKEFDLETLGEEQLPQYSVVKLWLSTALLANSAHPSMCMISGIPTMLPHLLLRQIKIHGNSLICDQLICGTNGKSVSSELSTIAPHLHQYHTYSLWCMYN